VAALGKDQRAKRAKDARDTESDRAGAVAAEGAGAAHHGVRAGDCGPDAEEPQQAGQQPRGAVAGYFL
jgi:hypothetical protein